MRASYLTVNNYRGIKEAHVNLSPFVCIVGENNAGKSSILLALSLFFSGTKLSSSEFYDNLQPILIEVTFEDINESDFLRLVPEHRERILELVTDGKLTLVRRYDIDGSSELMCKRALPKDPRFDTDTISALLKGKKGNDLKESLVSHLPEYAGKFDVVTTQTAAKAVLVQIISELPETELEIKDAPLPTGISSSIRNFLPETIYIPAVKDVTDEVKTKETATFGKLLGILLKTVEGAAEVQKVVQSFKDLRTLLNIMEMENGDRVDNRLPQVRNIETLLEGYLKESFPRVNVELRIPPPELKQVFSTAQIFLDDGVVDSVDTKGDGLKRSVTFALLRSYVEMKRVQSNPREEGQVQHEEAPYLFLFEEPELYLHPSAQRILFDALSRISTSHQVVVTTHSPMFFSPTSVGTFIKIIKKYPEGERPFGHVISVNLLSNISARNAFQMICYENNSAAFFANRVVLVEGDSDLQYFKHVSKVLNSDWDFDAKNIPLVRINGKGNVKRYTEFFKEFEVEVHVILDLDVITGDFDKLEVPAELLECRRQLLDALDEVAATQGIDGTLSKDKVKELIRGYTFRQRYSRLKEIFEKVKNGGSPSEDELVEGSLLFSEEVENKRKQALSAGVGAIPLKDELINRLRMERVYVLSKGTVEDYYPNIVAGSDKPSKAINACNLMSTKEQVRECCPMVEQNGKSIPELEAIFTNIFIDK